MKRLLILFTFLCSLSATAQEQELKDLIDSTITTLRAPKILRVDTIGVRMKDIVDFTVNATADKAGIDTLEHYYTIPEVDNIINNLPVGGGEGANPNYWVTDRTGVAISSLSTGMTTNYWPVAYMINPLRPDSVLIYTKDDGLKHLYANISTDSGATATLVGIYLQNQSASAPNAVNWFYNQLQNPNGTFRRGDSLYTYFVYNNNSVATSSPLLTGLGLSVAPVSAPYVAARVHVNPVLTITQAAADWSLANAPDYITIGGRMVERDTVWAFVGISRIVQATNRYTMICRYRVVNDTLFVPDRILVRPQGKYTYICDFNPFKWTDSNYYASLTEAPLFTSANARVRYLKSTDGRNWQFMNGSFLSPLNVADDRSRNYCNTHIFYPDNTNRYLMPYKGGNSYRVLYSLTRGSQDRFASCEVYPNSFDAQIKDNQNNIILRNGLPGISINPVNGMTQIGGVSGLQVPCANPAIIFGTGATTSVTLNTLATGLSLTTNGYVIAQLDSILQKAVVGTRNSWPINFISNNIERMSLTAGGSLLVGTTTDIPSAILSATSTTKGFLVPRMTTTQRDAISSPAEGLEIYNLTDHKKQVYDGTAWQNCW